MSRGDPSDPLRYFALSGWVAYTVHGKVSQLFRCAAEKKVACLFSDFQTKSKRATLPIALGLCPDASAVGFDEVLGNRQADA
jgi:hypothetical protein